MSKTLMKMFLFVEAEILQGTAGIRPFSSLASSVFITFLPRE